MEASAEVVPGSVAQPETMASATAQPVMIWPDAALVSRCRSELLARGITVVDGLLQHSLVSKVGVDTARRASAIVQSLRERALALHYAGRTRHGVVKDSDGSGKQATSRVERGDYVCWLRFDGTRDCKFGDDANDTEDHAHSEASSSESDDDGVRSKTVAAFGVLARKISQIVWKAVDEQLQPSMMMLAVYPPACDAGFRVHLDNPEGDGRMVTTVYYLNDGWLTEHGSLLRAWTAGAQSRDEIVEVQPDADRLVMFFSETVRHEVTPNLRQDLCPAAHRCALTIWYYSEEEAAQHLGRTAGSGLQQRKRSRQQQPRPRCLRGLGQATEDIDNVGSISPPGRRTKLAISEQEKDGAFGTPDDAAGCQSLADSIP